MSARTEFFLTAALWLVLIGLLACNAQDFVLTPRASPHASVTTLPTPSSSPTIPAPTTYDCGNAEYQVLDTYDPDDHPGQPDSYWCVWMCAIDAGDPIWGSDPNPPSEVWKRYDLDAPQPAYQFEPTRYLPCNSARP